MADDVVLSERRGAVALLTLNRPDRLNAWTGALGRRYFDLLDAAAADPEVRVIVVTGAGRGFCAGAEVGRKADSAEGVTAFLEKRDPDWKLKPSQDLPASYPYWDFPTYEGE